MDTATHHQSFIEAGRHFPAASDNASMRFDLTDLRIFLHACESGSMTQAADRCSLTLAAVSARIRALEDRTGVPLLRRHARGVVATAAGEALARHARLLFHQLDAMRRELAPDAAAQPGAVVLLANSSAVARPLHHAVAEVLEAHAGARLSVRESASEVTVHALRNGAAQVGIISDAAAAEELVTEVLGPDPLALIVPLGHALAGRGTLSFVEVLDHEWVVWGEGSALHTHLVMQAHRNGGALRATVSVPSVEGVVALIARGRGVGVLPRALLQGMASAAQVQALELSDAWADRRLLLCRSPELDDPVALALFRVLKTQWKCE